MRAPLVPVAVACVAGAAVGLTWTVPAGAVLAIGLAAAVLGVAPRVRPGAAGAAVIVLWACVGLLRADARRAHPAVQLSEELPDEPGPVAVRARVRDAPVPPASGPRDRARDPSCVLELTHVRRDGRWKAASGALHAVIGGRRALPEAGDSLLAEGVWSRPRSPGNPGQYDWGGALLRRGVAGVLRVKASDALVILPDGGGRSPRAALRRWRRRAAEAFRDRVPPEEAGIVEAVLLGERRDLDPALRERFRRTGTVHLLVVSGLHVGMVMVLLEALLRLAGMPWRIRPWFVAAGVAGYGLLTGMSTPVVRAASMAALALGAIWLDRERSWGNLLAAAALLVVLAEPASASDPGFQLSFGAVASLLAFGPRWSKAIAARLSWVKPGALRAYLAGSLAATGAVWAGLAPLLIWYTGIVSPVAAAANLVLIPIVTALVWTGPFALAALEIPAIGASAAWVPGTLARAAAEAAAWFERIPGGWWETGRSGVWLPAAYYALLALSALSGRLRISVERVIIAWTAALALWLWSVAGTSWSASRWLRVDLLDVGHGDSAVIRTPSGHVLVVDAGTREAGAARVVPFLRAEGIRRLDALILTHPDEDHLGGAAPLLEAVRVGRLLTNGAPDDTMAFRRVMAGAGRAGLAPEGLCAGAAFGPELGADIEVLHPPCGFVPGTAPASNDNALVLRLRKGRVRILLTADIEEAGIPILLAGGSDVAADVMTAPHHGSRLGEAGERLFDAARPAVAVVSVGRAHRLPAPGTIDALRRRGAQVLLTRDAGAVRIMTDGESIVIRTHRRR